MKKLLNIIFTILIALVLPNKAFANYIDKTISQSGINKGAVSISVKDVNTGKVVYELNGQKPSIPASTLKIVTLAASLDTLKDDYKFSTKLYKTINNELHLKLGGDPFLSTSDLNKLLKTAYSKNILEPKAVYIDDYIFDSTEWGEGWQWDDDLNPLMPKFSSYNIDNNLLNIVISPTRAGAPASIHSSVFYPTTFMNLTKTGNGENIEINRNNSISPDMLTVKGNITKQITKQIPVNYPKRYFLLRLEEAIQTAKIDYFGKFPQKKLPASNVYLVDEVSHPIDQTIDAILKNSNNFIAETVFKAAGAKYVNNTGSLANSQAMINSYFDKIGINHEDIKIVDGSGVSKNNLVTADFMTEFLLKNYNNKDYINHLPKPGEGTLTNRMLYFKDNLSAKTGTLSDMSSITGYITSRHGNTYAFDIIINDSKSKQRDKKSLEEYILRDIYANF